MTAAKQLSAQVKLNEKLTKAVLKAAQKEIRS
jgi:hypothetical protein